MHEFATATMGTLRRLSNASDRATEARMRMPAGLEGAPAAALLPVKRLSEELAAVLRKRDSWTATVAPLPVAAGEGSDCGSMHSAKTSAAAEEAGAGRTFASGPASTSGRAACYTVRGHAAPPEVVRLAGCPSDVKRKLGAACGRQIAQGFFLGRG